MNKSSFTKQNRNLVYVYAIVHVFNQPKSFCFDSDEFGSMFGPLLRRSILQGSALRTWNYLTNFTQLLWCKLKYLRELRVSCNTFYLVCIA